MYSAGRVGKNDNSLIHLINDGDPSKCGLDFSNHDGELSYHSADISKGQQPGLAEHLDGNKDGFLTPDEYAAGRGAAGANKNLPEDFDKFKQLALMSENSPEAVEKLLGAREVVRPQLSAADQEAERKAAEQVAWILVERAKGEEYQDARRTLAQAGAIFSRFGFVAEAESCQKEMQKRATVASGSANCEEAALAKADQALGRGIEAIRKGDEAGMRRELEAIPEGHEGREVLEGYLADIKHAGRVEKQWPTLMAAMAIAERKLVKDKGDRAGHERMLKDMFKAWQDRVESGEFESTEAILKDLWEKEVWCRQSLAFLSGHEDGFYVDKEGLEWVSGWLSEREQIIIGAHEVVLSDLLAIERGIDQETFNQRVCNILNPGDRDMDEQLVGSEFEALAEIYGKRDATKGYATEFGKHKNVQPDILFQMTVAAPFAELFGAAVLGVLARPIWKLASKLPFGKAINGLLYNGTIEGTEAVAVSGGFTIFSVGEQLIDHPEAKINKGDVMKQWGSLALPMILARFAHVPLAGTRRLMGKTRIFGEPKAEPVIIRGQKLPALNPLGKVTYTVIDQAANTGAFYSGGMIAHRLGWRGDSPHFFQEWLTLLQFQVGGHLANKMTGGQLQRKAFEIKNRPYLEASHRIAERLVGGKGAEANAMAEVLYMAHVNGDVEATALLRASDYMQKGSRGGDTISAVLEVNKVLEKAETRTRDGRVFVYDGVKLYAVGAEVRDAYVKEVMEQRAARARLPITIPNFAMAMVTADADAGIGPSRKDGREVGPADKVETTGSKEKSDNSKTPAEKPSDVSANARPHIIAGNSVASGTGVFDDVPVGQKVLLIDFAPEQIPADRANDAVVADHHSADGAGKTATGEAWRLCKEGKLDAVVKVVSNHNDTDSVLAEAIGRGLITDPATADKAVRAARAGDHLVGDKDDMVINWTIMSMIHGDRGGKFAAVPRDEIVAKAADIIEHPEKYEQYYQGMKGFIDASEAAVKSGKVEVRGRVGMIETGTYAHPLAGYWALEPTTADVMIKYTPHEKGGLQFDIGFVPSKAKGQLNLASAFEELKQMEADAQRRANPDFDAAKSGNWGCDPTRAGGSPRAYGSLLTPEQVHEVIARHVTGESDVQEKLSDTTQPRETREASVGATPVASQPLTEELLGKFPAFRRQIERMIQKAPKDRKAEIEAAIADAINTTLHGQDWNPNAELAYRLGEVKKRFSEATPSPSKEIAQPDMTNAPRPAKAAVVADRRPEDTADSTSKPRRLDELQGRFPKLSGQIKGILKKVPYDQRKVLEDEIAAAIEDIPPDATEKEGTRKLGKALNKISSRLNAAERSEATKTPTTFDTEAAIYSDSVLIEAKGWLEADPRLEDHLSKTQGFDRAFSFSDLMRELTYPIYGNESARQSRLGNIFKLVVYGIMENRFRDPAAARQFLVEKIIPKLSDRTKQEYVRKFESDYPWVIELIGSPWPRVDLPEGHTDKIPSGEGFSLQRDGLLNAGFRQIGKSGYFERACLVVRVGDDGRPALFKDAFESDFPKEISGNVDPATLDARLKAQGFSEDPSTKGVWTRKIDSGGWTHRKGEMVAFVKDGRVQRVVNTIPSVPEHLLTPDVRFVSYISKKGHVKGPGVVFLSGHLEVTVNEVGVLDQKPLVPLEELSPAEAGAIPMEPKPDPGTGFVYGGVNSTETIRGLTSIAGIPIGYLENNMRPWRFSDRGFLGNDESLLGVMAKDNDYVSSRGLTHQKIAEALKVIRHMTVSNITDRPGPTEVVFRGRRYRLTHVQWLSGQDSPFNDRIFTNQAVTVENMENGEKMAFSGMLPDFIEKYGFYEGDGTPYRLPPEQILSVLDFLVQ